MARKKGKKSPSGRKRNIDTVVSDAESVESSSSKKKRTDEDEGSITNEGDIQQLDLDLSDMDRYDEKGRLLPKKDHLMNSPPNKMVSGILDKYGSNPSRPQKINTSSSRALFPQNDRSQAIRNASIEFDKSKKRDIANRTPLLRNNQNETQSLDPKTSSSSATTQEQQPEKKDSPKKSSTILFLNKARFWIVAFFISYMFFVPKSKNIENVSLSVLDLYKDIYVKNYDYLNPVKPQKRYNQATTKKIEIEEKETSEVDIPTHEEEDDEYEYVEEEEEEVTVYIPPSVVEMIKSMVIEHKEETETSTNLVNMRTNELMEMSRLLKTPSYNSLYESEGSLPFSSLYTDTGVDISTETSTLIRKRKDEIASWESALEEAEKAMSELESDEDGDIEQYKLSIKKLSEVSPVLVSQSLFDNDSIELSNEGCDIKSLPNVDEIFTNDENNDEKMEDTDDEEEEEEDEEMPVVENEFLHIDMFEEGMQYIEELARTATVDLQTEPKLLSSVKKWIEGEVADAMNSSSLDTNSLESSLDNLMDEEEKSKEAKAEIVKQNTLSREIVLNAIDNVLQKVIKEENEMGKTDYASLRSGASIIRTGSRGTSPGISDTLPVFNNILSKLGLRHYGHSAEVALSMTYPKNALGQCWSFERKSYDKDDQYSSENDDDAQGDYATLAVNLSDEIYVQGIVIEHPPKDITTSPGTAIKKFRLFGFEEPGAKGFSWDLGSFMYDIDSSSEQAFQVSSHAHGIQVPALRSVVLAIDSNWGEEYSCLYRFRVHGNPHN